LTQAIIAAALGLLGIRMLWVATQTRARAEAWIGLFFLATGLGGHLSLLAVARSTDRPLAVLLAFIGVPILTVATVAGYAFTYTVFRRGERWALAIVAGGTLLALWGTWQQLGGASLRPDTAGLRLEFLFGRFACFAWGTAEGFHAYRMARRRLALGLTDRVLVNRFALFTIWYGAMGLMPVTLAISRLYGGAGALEVAQGLPPKLLGVLMIVALTLTFFPPRRYLAWVLAPAKDGRP
jgi:hypothetical protein